MAQLLGLDRRGRVRDLAMGATPSNTLGSSLYKATSQCYYEWQEKVTTLRDTITFLQALLEIMIKENETIQKKK